MSLATDVRRDLHQSLGVLHRQVELESREVKELAFRVAALPPARRFEMLPIRRL